MLSKTNIEAINNREFSPNFLATIRAIMDSKYNEFLMSDDPKTYSKFPDFVFGWLGMYELDNKFKIKINTDLAGKSSFAADDIRLNFYLDL